MTILLKMVVEDKKVKRVSYLPVWIDDDTFVPEILTPADEKFQKVVDYMTEITASQNIEPRFTVDGDEVVIG